ncbi:MAG: 16S rRNA (cytidine(1402)-2'-O)-methyltransferase [Xanthomonadales bacterium]|jgi:16S rRNA (cytidine1402-2'-O)-methyltransferase|nr:16S rRNA (cytidine(1402)-2'-O)-methyltransferase [Xanthomonadales bacterium]
MEKACLHVVATPIGNLEDISLRALDVLAKADVVAAEDTRRSRQLLSRHGIDRSLVTLHEHNEEKQAPQLVRRLLDGESVALVSDAGTPLLSDPGYRLVCLAVENGIDVVAVPGPSAVTAALSVAGLPTDRFTFEGFLPARAAARLKRLQSLQGETRTLVFFESSHRIEACLADLEQAFGPDRPAAVCRELTKQFETVLRGGLGEIRAAVENDPNQRKGEFVIVVGGGEAQVGGLVQAKELANALKEHVGASQAARIAARIHGVSRRDVYNSGSE